MSIYKVKFNLSNESWKQNVQVEVIPVWRMKFMQKYPMQIIYLEWTFFGRMVNADFEWLINLVELGFNHFFHFLHVYFFAQLAFERSNSVSEESTRIDVVEITHVSIHV